MYSIAMTTSLIHGSRGIANILHIYMEENKIYLIINCIYTRGLLKMITISEKKNMFTSIEMSKVCKM